MLAAMKAKEETKLGALRLLKAAIMKFEVSGASKKEASDEEVLQIIGKEVKQRKDSIEAYKKGGRENLAQQEEEEMKILQAYLPEQMSEEEVKKVVQAVIKQIGAPSAADMGKVMGVASKQLAGLADGKTISNIVKELLSK